MRDYIKKTIDTYNALADRYTDHRKGLVMQDLIDRLVGLMSGNELLEIGSGPGRDAKVFVEKGLTVTGIDLSEKLIEIARVAVPAATFIVGDTLELPFEDNSFDGIWSAATLHHLKKEDMPIALHEVRRVLKIGAPAFISVKSGQGEVFQQDSEFDGRERFFSFTTQEEFTQLLQTAQFEIVDMWGEQLLDRFKDYKHGAQKGYISAFVRKL